MLDDRYAAGLFDGEGYVRCTSWAKPSSTHVRYQVIAGINMTHRPVIEALYLTFGGNLYESRRDLRPEHYRTLFNWTVASQKAASFLRRVTPHLIVKREQAELALSIQASIDLYRGTKLGNQYWSHPDRDRVFAERAEMAARISALKNETFAPFSLVSPKAREPSEGLPSQAR